MAWRIDFTAFGLPILPSASAAKRLAPCASSVTIRQRAFTAFLSRAIPRLRAAAWRTPG